jgi:hypothetical protein
VDWFLAKYCRCRLRLDWCWCRWRTSMKGHRRWVLQVWRRQVGFVRGTRWPMGSSAGRMVAWTARWSHGRFLGEPQNQGRVRTTWEPSCEWRFAEATPSSRGFWWFTRKPLGSLVDPQRQDRRTEHGTAAAPDRSDQWVWPVGTTLTGEEHRSDRCATTQSGIFEAEDTRRDRMACVKVKQGAVAGHPSDAEILTSKTALERLMSLVIK